MVEGSTGRVGRPGHQEKLMSKIKVRHSYRPFPSKDKSPGFQKGQLLAQQVIFTALGNIERSDEHDELFAGFLAGIKSMVNGD